jgi:hypothetical protein
MRPRVSVYASPVMRSSRAPPSCKVTHVAFTSPGHPTPDRTYGYDANGRRTLESSPAFGSKYSQYDPRGMLTTVQEAAGGGVSFPSTISYDYYADGARKAVSVGTTSNLITYSYRADGARTAAAMNYSGRTFPFTFAYTDGGRMTSRTDPFTNTVIPNASPPVTPGSRYAPQSWNYDATGQLASLGMPYAYAYNGVSHDAEGHMLGWHINLPTYGDVQTAFTNSVRGENVGSTLSTSANGPISMSRVKLLHGAPVPSTRYTAPDFIDSYNGIVTSQTGYSEHDPYGDGLVTRNCPNPNYVRDTYDRAGRMTMHDYAAYDSTPIDCQQISPATGTTTYAYDSDDHTVLINGKCVGWGPDGHALTFSNFGCSQTGPGQSVNTAHYDGDSILIVSTQDSTGTHYSARLEQLGTMVVSSSGVSFTVGERDMSGNTVGWHNDTGYQGRSFGTRVWTVSVGQPRGGLFDAGAQTTYQNQYSVAISGSGSGNGTFSVDAQGGNLWYDASDGFTFEGKRFQGVRVMDPETGHWTSPDAYAGEVHDPMSQKPFMWNRNNPYEYHDSTGYCIGPLVVVCYELLVIGAAAVAEAGAPGAAALGGVASRTLVIGKVAELNTLRIGERSLLSQLEGSLGTPKAYWARNAGALRQAMRSGKPIRDAHVTADGELIKETKNTFLNAERALLIERGWTYNKSTTMWQPPPAQPLPGPPPMAIGHPEIERF